MTESVWDYPRPPAIQPSARRARVAFGGAAIADSRSALRVLETSHPPAIYFPREDALADSLRPVPGQRTFCEFKGIASYFDVVGSDGLLAPLAAWTYSHPDPAYAALRDLVAFYPSKMDGCWLDDEPVVAQEGDLYGGWITADITGPFKGGSGTRSW